MLSHKDQIIKITSTETYAVQDVNEAELINDLNPAPVGIENNRRVLQKLLPQFADRKLEAWACQ